MISIVMASYLGAYPGAATDRDTKLRRAIDSVLAQTVKEWELVVVADGCEATLRVLADYSDPRIVTCDIDKQPLWSPAVRNVGQYKATGDWIIYLDTDDYFGPQHLEKIVLPKGDWGYFNLREWRTSGKYFAECICNVTQAHTCGTGNLIHKKGYYWPESANDYKHDWTFIKELRAAGPGTKLPTPEYFVCHIPKGPNKCDV